MVSQSRDFTVAMNHVKSSTDTRGNRKFHVFKLMEGPCNRSLRLLAQTTGMLLVPWLITDVHAANQYKVSIGQYRIVEADQQSYWLNSLGAQYKYRSFKLQLTQPVVTRDTEQGRANGLVKITKQGRLANTFVDVHLRQRLGNADREITLPTHDTGVSIELSHKLWHAIGFVEMGYWWRERTDYQRKDTAFYSMGLAAFIAPQWMGGGYIDHKPTAYGDLDRSVSVFTQYKLDSHHRFTLVLGQGLEPNSPDWLAGLQWSYASTIGQ